jgi:hypothetical protein
MQEGRTKQEEEGEEEEEKEEKAEGRRIQKCN